MARSGLSRYGHRHRLGLLTRPWTQSWSGPRSGLVQFGGDWGPVDEQAAGVRAKARVAPGPDRRLLLIAAAEPQPTPGRGRYGSMRVPGRALRVTLTCQGRQHRPDPGSCR